MYQKSMVLILGCLLAVGTLSGCIVRTYSVVKDRVDQDLEGNRGYIQGSAASTEEAAARKKTRQVEVVEIELRSPVEIQEPKETSKDKEVGAGNRGYISGSPQMMTEPAPESQEATLTAVATADTYTVQKGDTLEKIAAKSEIYGDYKKWRKIYEANQDKLKSKDKIYPGQVLIIPRD
jgi:nucleoid-associated protein YgaU